jgi:uncharacterized membrane protein
MRFLSIFRIFVRLVQQFTIIKSPCNPSHLPPVFNFRFVFMFLILALAHLMVAECWTLVDVVAVNHDLEHKRRRCFLSFEAFNLNRLEGARRLSRVPL